VIVKDRWIESTPGLLVLTGLGDKLASLKPSVFRKYRNFIGSASADEFSRTMGQQAILGA
jgi:hypothetical protein